MSPPFPAGSPLRSPSSLRIPLPALLLLSFFSLPAALYAVEPAERSRIVAVVNDEVITEGELHKALVPAYLQMQATLGPEELSQRMQELRKKILQQIIDERLMLQEARNPRPVEVAKGRIGTPPPISVEDSEVEEMLAQTRGRFESPEAFEEALSQQGLSVEDLRARYRDQITIQKLIGREIRSRISISPAEITAYYQAHPQEFKTPQAVQVATILIRPADNAEVARAYAQAQDLRRQLGQGADFYELAKRYSDGFNAKLGGRIGWLEKGRNRKEIDEVLFDLKVGQVSPVIKTPVGFQIFLIESARAERQAELSEVQGQIEILLQNQKGSSKFGEWIARLRADAYISVK